MYVNPVLRPVKSTLGETRLNYKHSMPRNGSFIWFQRKKRLILRTKYELNVLEGTDIQPPPPPPKKRYRGLLYCPRFFKFVFLS